MSSAAQHISKRKGYLLRRLKRFACVTALNSNDCGPAALASVARHHGMYVGTEAIRILGGTTFQGTDLRRLHEAALALGFAASYGKAKENVLDAIPLPAIAHFNDSVAGHFVVIHDVSDASVTIADPATGVVTLERQQFMARWSQYLLLLAPSPAFQTSSRPPSQFVRLLKLSFKETKIAVLSVLLAVVLVALGYGMSFIVQRTLDQAIPHKDYQYLQVVTIGALAIVMFRFISSTVRQILLAYIGYRLELFLGLTYADRVLSLPVDFFERRSAGDIFSRTNDVNKVATSAVRNILSTIPDAIFLMLSSLVLFWYSPQLAAIVVSFVPVIILVSFAFMRPLLTKQRLVRHYISNWASQFVESLHSIKTIKAFCGETYMYGRIASIYRDLQGATKAASILSDSLGTICLLLTGAASVMLLWAGAHFAFTQELSIGQLMFFYSVTGMFLGAAERIAPSISALQEAMVSSERLEAINSIKPENNREEETKPLSMPVLGKIEFVDVGFSFRSGDPVLHDINLTINPGDWIVILGETGSGKSTLANMILGFYLAQKGNVYIDGISLHDLDKVALRQQISIVFQDAGLMDGTISENIGFPVQDANLDLIQLAAEQAQIHEFILTLPQQYNYNIGPFGSLLSSGQRQRIAIARALMKNSAVLVLDEATSNLDLETEQRVMRAIRQQRVSRTTLVITHRVPTAKDADMIVVLRDGAVVEKGRHDELLAKCGDYYKMWQTCQQGSADMPRDEEVFT